MNIDDLDKALSAKDASLLPSFFAGLSEAERKSLSARVLEWINVAEAFSNKRTIDNFRLARIELSKAQQKSLKVIQAVQKGEVKIPQRAQNVESLKVSSVAALAVCGITDIRKVGFTNPEISFALIESRRPAFTNKWLDLACQSDEAGTVWHKVRQFERQGIATACRQSGYWLSMAITLGQFSEEELLNYFDQDTEILEHHLWCMLEDQDAMEALSDPGTIAKEFQEVRTRSWLRILNWDRWRDKSDQWHKASVTWRGVLVRLANCKTIDRKRLLRCFFNKISTLSADSESRPSARFSEHPLSPVEWYQSIHDAIINEDESLRAGFTNQYIGLLNAKDSKTLVWSIDNLCQIESNNYLESDILSTIPKLMVHKSKKPAIAALKLLTAIYSRSLQKEEVVLAALVGMEHRSPEIHKKVVSLLKKTNAFNHPLVLDKLDESIEHMSGLYKSELRDLVESYRTSEKSPHTSPDFTNVVMLRPKTVEKAEEDVDDDIQVLISQTKAIPMDLFTAAEIQAVLDVLDKNAELPKALTLTSSTIPRLNSNNRIQPLNTLDDLIFAFASVLEANPNMDTVEKVLDGLSRLSSERPDDFESRTSSLKKKADEVITRMYANTPFQPFSQGILMIDLAALVQAWIGHGKRNIVSSFLNALGAQLVGLNLPPGPMHFFSARMASIAKLISSKHALPLLSAPTHKHGFIDPLVLPERLSSWQKSGVKFEKTDVIQCLLRLAPDNASEALSQIPKSNDEAIRAIRFALGDNLSEPLATPELWVAAWRCRFPNQSNQELDNRFDGLGPGAFILSTYEENLNCFKKPRPGIYDFTGSGLRYDLILRSLPAVKSHRDIKFYPTVLLNDHIVRWDTSSAIEYLYLKDRESFFVYNARRIITYLESQNSYTQVTWECLFDPEVSLNGYGSWFIALALSAKQQESNRAALDALICAIEECRIDGDKLGIVMVKLNATDKMTPGRWIKSLREIMRISPLHNYFVSQCMTHYIAGLSLDNLKTPPVAVLELLYESTSSLDADIENMPTRVFLEGIEGKGKGAKLAKLLLELKADEARNYRQTIGVCMLRSRTDRAQRWQQSVKAHVTVR